MVTSEIREYFHTHLSNTMNIPWVYNEYTMSIPWVYHEYTIWLPINIMGDFITLAIVNFWHNNLSCIQVF